jgi:class 3 adenylate cyclase
VTSEHVERRLAAILVADLVGYSRLVGADEEGMIARLGALREELIDPCIGKHQGRIVKTTGDGLLVEFASAVDAVRCAVEFQRALAERESGQPVDLRIAYRIGINVGDIVVKGDDILGDGVNVAARLEGLAEPGGICISRSARDQVRDRLKISLKDLGEIEVKNIARPVRVFRVLLNGEAPPKARAAAAQRKSSSLRPALSAMLVVLIVAGGLVAWFWPWERPTEPSAVESASAPEIARPSRHFRVERPADLEAADALTIYDRIRSELVAVYRKSANPHAAVYQTWRRYNVAPYLSATHGQLYVNNYANQRAVDYGKAETAGTFPEGSVLAKDSFEVTDLGDVFTGPLALMEKMPPGFSPDNRDWRYTMIMPDGSLFGTTNGENSVRVEYCAECHRGAGDEQDHLFFVPEEHRVKFLNLPKKAN